MQPVFNFQYPMKNQRKVIITISQIQTFWHKLSKIVWGNKK